MKHFCKISLFILLIITKLNAQPPGYRGKRLAIQYQPNFNLNPKNVDESGNSKILVPMIGQGLYLEYVLSRRTSIGGKYSFQNSKFNFESNDPFGYYTYITKIAKLSEHQISILTKIYRKNKGNLAPFGTYTQFNLSNHYFYAEDLQDKDSNYTNNNIFTLGIAFGKQRIFRHCIVFDMNIKFSIPYTMNKNTGENLYGITEKMVKTQNILGFNIGIGYLAPKIGR